MLTLKRVRVYTTLIAVTIWTVYAADMSGHGPLDRLGKVKGTDFLQFYVLGSIAHERRWADLYDAGALAARAHAIAPASSETTYLPIQSPQVALAAAPLARLPYESALALWVAFAVATCAICSLALWTTCASLRRWPREAVMSCAAFPGFFAVVVNGQVSFVALASVVAALTALRRGRRLEAGFALGLLIFKPHWAIAAAAVFAAAGEGAVLGGIVAGAAIETGLTALLVPVQVMRAYAHTLAAAPAITALLEPQPGESLKALFKVIVPFAPAAMACYAAASAAVLAAAAHVWRSAAPFELRASAAVLAMILISPHANSYDLVLLAPVFFLMAGWLADAPLEAGWVVPLLAALYIGPMLGALPAAIRLLFTAVAMSAMLALCARASGFRSRLSSVPAESGREGFRAAAALNDR